MALRPRMLKASRFCVQVSYLRDLLLLDSGGAALLAKAQVVASERVSPERRRVTATSENSSAYSVLNLFDGDPKTNWLARNSVPLPQSVAVELPLTLPIERITLRQSSQRLDYNTRHYRVELSSDGYHFEPAAEGKLPLEAAAARSHDLGAKSARFIRIAVLSMYPAAPYSQSGRCRRWKSLQEASQCGNCCSSRVIQAVDPAGKSWIVTFLNDRDAPKKS